ncbi:MAG: hypothetical protein JXA04_05300 [Gammaproteobacteria bacterium]|nr:hypothetical protein [Gammaproteobacteria bacterium]
MKNKCLLLSLLLLGAYATTASAGEWLVGARVGVAEFDAPDTDPGVAAYLMVGKEMWNIGAADIAIEGEAGVTVIDGEYGPNNDDLSFSTFGAYAALRTKGPVYVIGRAGVVRSEVDAAGAPSTVDDTSTDPSFGIGVGFGGMGLKWEVLFTSYGTDGSDVDVISLGLLF